MHRALLWLALINFVLAPLSTLHAHAADDHHEVSTLHGGHLHGFDGGDADHHGANAEQVIDVQLVASDRGAGDFRWTEWLPLIFALGVAWLTLPYLTSILRPPPIDELPIPHRHHWKPPLRGPPLISIPVL